MLVEIVKSAIYHMSHFIVSEKSLITVYYMSHVIVNGKKNVGEMELNNQERQNLETDFSAVCRSIE